MDPEHDNSTTTLYQLCTTHRAKLFSFHGYVALTDWHSFCDVDLMAKKEAKRAANKWVRKVKTVSTSPPKDLFTKDAQTIAKTMASKNVSPKGVGSGIRTIQFFINRAGKDLSPTRRKELEKAKRLLQKKQERQ